MKFSSPEISVSLVPDGTEIAQGKTSVLFAAYGAKYPAHTWQMPICAALQLWADVAPIKFRTVTDDGSPYSAVQHQGDPRFGDIRFGAYAWPGTVIGATLRETSDGTTIDGSRLALNVNSLPNVGSYPDLFSVILHESGHALGLNHSTVRGAVMYPTLGTYTGLHPDDIQAVQFLYGVKPIPIVIDDHPPNFVGLGSWTRWANNPNVGTDKAIGGSYLTAPPSPPISKATWTITTLTPGTWNVKASCIAHSTRATNAVYRIYDSGALLAEKRVNQRGLAGTGELRWNDLGTFLFSSWTPRVELSTEGADGYLTADAVQFSPV